MEFDDLSFEVEENGNTFKCDVLAVIPNKDNREEPYVIYTDYSLDSNDEFVRKYGKLVNENNNYYIEKDIKEEEKQYIETCEKDEMVSYVNQKIEEALYED